jgi:hypothetical protein
VSLRTISVQIATIIFTSRLKKELSSLGQNADDIASLIGNGVVTGDEVPTVDASLLIQAYQRAIRDGLVVAVVFAAFALLFAVALPWPRLKGGITHQRQGEGLENNGVSEDVDHSNSENER